MAVEPGASRPAPLLPRCGSSSTWLPALPPAGDGSPREDCDCMKAAARGPRAGASGTGACAALVAAHRQGLTDRKAVLVMDGGELQIEWRASDDHVLMTGPVETEFEGLLP